MVARLANWREVIATANLSADRQMDAVSKWLIITRAAVFSMTLFSGLIGLLLAVESMPEAVHYGYAAVAILGIVIAHAVNNIINDSFDLEVGIDTADYVRAVGPRTSPRARCQRACVATLPYAILVTSVLMGKHIDMIAADGTMGIHTLPVILGEATRACSTRPSWWRSARSCSARRSSAGPA